MKKKPKYNVGLSSSGLMYKCVKCYETHLSECIMISLHNTVSNSELRHKIKTTQLWHRLLSICLSLGWRGKMSQKSVRHDTMGLCRLWKGNVIASQQLFRLTLTQKPPQKKLINHFSFLPQSRLPGRRSNTCTWHFHMPTQELMTATNEVINS